MNGIIRLAADIECIPKTLDFLEENLSFVKGISAAKKQLTMMKVEDCMTDVIKVADPGKFISIEHKYFAGKSKIYILYHGDRIEESKIVDDIVLIEEDDKEILGKAIKNLVAKVFSNKCVYHYNGNIGVIEIWVKTSIYNLLLIIFAFLIVGIFGVIIISLFI